MNGAIRITERRAFTLIELLVVISIIGVLMGLILSGVQRFRIAAKRAQAVVEINQLSAACDTFKNEYGFYPPSSFSGNPADPLLKQMYPRWKGTGYSSPGALNGARCMAYFLGGPNGTGWDFGGPFAPSTAATSKKGPYYDFPTSRIANYQFTDPWGRAYAYIGTDSNGKYPAGAVNATGSGDNISAYFKLVGATQKFESDGKCQIISAGNNKNFGPGGSWTPGAGSYAGYSASGTDDVANFNGGVQLGSIP